MNIYLALKSYAIKMNIWREEVIYNTCFSKTAS